MINRKKNLRQYVPSYLKTSKVYIDITIIITGIETYNGERVTFVFRKIFETHERTVKSILSTP